MFKKCSYPQIPIAGLGNPKDIPPLTFEGLPDIGQPVYSPGGLWDIPM